MLNKKYLKLLFIGIPLVVLCWGLLDFVSSIKVLNANKKLGNKYIPFKYPEHTTIYDFLLKKSENITSVLTYYSSSKEPLSTYLYDSKINIIIFEMNGLYQKPLNELIIQRNKRINQNNNVVYEGSFSPKLVKLMRRSDRPSKVIGKYYFNIRGDSIQLIKSTKDLIYYKFNLAQASLSYGSDEIVDIFMERRKLFGENPKMEVMFKREKKKVYILMAFAKEQDDGLPENLLLNILNHSYNQKTY